MTTIDEGLPQRDLRPEQIYALPELRYPERLNAGRELVDAHADGGRAGRPAIVHGDRVVTYGELQGLVNRLGNGLRGLGLGRGDRLLLRLGNVPEFVVTWLACQKLGIVTVSTMPMLRARELAYIIDDAETTAAVVEGGIRDELEKAQGEARSLARLIVVGEARPGDTTWASLLDGQSPRLPAEETRAGEVAMLAYTSGSTGVPKGCAHFQSDVLAIADTFARLVLGASEEDRFGGHPTLAFLYGFDGLMVFPLRFGAATVLTGPFQPEAMLEAIQRHRISICFCVPTAYKLMLRTPAMERRFDLGSLRLGVSAAEPLPAATYEEWTRRTGAELLDGIGTTETGHFMSSVPGKVRPGTTGVAVPGFDCRVVDDAGREVPRGTPGLVALKGPTGCKYWRKPDRQAEQVRFGGWTVPGDVFVRDPDGYFWYQCRSDDMVVSGGNKVPAPEVEHVLDRHPAVAECAVVASPDETRGHVVKAYVVLKPGTSPSEALVAELQEHVKQELAPYKYPRRIEFIERLPRTETGKIRRAELRRRELERTAPR